ncbi:MAG: AAA family ATPase [Saprospiraceae bacterium]|nr:AAA family ATPase [Saprospiraceae bacterium]
MMDIAGRKEEIALLRGLLTKDDSELVAVYGWRRIGKTFLVRQVYARHLVFECSGLHERSFAQQLENFWLALVEANPDAKTELPPKTWLQAFAQLKSCINALPKGGKKVIFLDEISWFETPRSGFLAALDNFWNQFCTKRSDIILVICGSAASWIINKVINDRGGLHNRITKHVQLMPFTLQETREFLDLKSVKWTLKDIAQLYMSVGGVPFYLMDIEPGKSVPQVLDDLFFVPQARLKNEFQNLYAALFKNSHLHEKIVQTLTSKNRGMTRREIIAASGLPSGGGLTTLLEELIACGFVKQIFPINKTKEDSLFRLIDEYTLFYYKFLYNLKTNNSWLQLSAKPAFKVWSSYAFETLCLKHVLPIKKALGIHGIISNDYSWFLKGDSTNAGVQIDLLIDRDDNCINLLELKFHEAEFEMSKAYASQLVEKVNAFKMNTHSRKNVFVTLLTAVGARKNEHYLSVVTNQLTIKDLFD